MLNPRSYHGLNSIILTDCSPNFERSAIVWTSIGLAYPAPNSSKAPCPIVLNSASSERGQRVQAFIKTPETMSLRTEDSNPTRQSLLERLKRWDDTSAWREFFATYWELIYKVARKVGLNDAEAQDVVQETVVGVLRKIGEFNTNPTRGSFKSWLLGQARWRIGDQFRARKCTLRKTGKAVQETREILDLPEEQWPHTDPPPHRTAEPSSDEFEALWNEEWEQHVLRTAMEHVKAQVSIKQFQMFELHVRQGLSVGDTAKAIGTTKASVYMAKSRVGRVLKRAVLALKLQ